MRMQSLPPLVPPLVQVAVLAACGGDPKNPAATTSVNHAPEVRSLLVEPPVIELGGTAMVMTMVADADGDPLACIYEAAHGTLTVRDPSTSCSGATYRNDGQPASSDLIRVTVTDRNNASASASAAVAILRPSPSPRPSPAPAPSPTAVPANPTPTPSAGTPPPSATATPSATPTATPCSGMGCAEPTPTPCSAVTCLPTPTPTPCSGGGCLATNIAPGGGRSVHGEHQ